MHPDAGVGVPRFLPTQGLATSRQGSSSLLGVPPVANALFGDYRVLVTAKVAVRRRIVAGITSVTAKLARGWVWRLDSHRHVCPLIWLASLVSTVPPPHRLRFHLPRATVQAYA